MHLRTTQKFAVLRRCISHLIRHPLSEEQAGERERERERAFVVLVVRNNGTGWLFSLAPLLALSMSCALCPTPFAQQVEREREVPQQHLKLLGPPNSGRSVAEWAPSLKRATDACVLASNNASPAQRGLRRDAQPLHPRHAACLRVAAVLFAAPLRVIRCFSFLRSRDTMAGIEKESTKSSNKRHAQVFRQAVLLHNFVVCVWRPACSPAPSNARAARSRASPTRRPSRRARPTGARREIQSSSACSSSSPTGRSFWRAIRRSAPTPPTRDPGPPAVSKRRCRRRCTFGTPT